MKLEDQILSIEQVQELQELGFDVRKYASMCWFEQTPFAPIEQPKIYELEILTYSLMGNRGYLEVIQTLTIGDIIELLPIEIDEYVLDMNRKYVSYDSKQNNLYYGYRHRFIDSLFDCLVWCIKQKHI